MKNKKTTIHGEDIKIYTEAEQTNEQRETEASTYDEKTDVNSSAFILSNFRLTTDYGDLFIAMFG
ncbi:MAG TPA: hypothetical protein VHA56_14825 [Mucilaginibacter sp.]|nr:hypothetical protein [Mucilaginibacter sp.]